MAGIVAKNLSPEAAELVKRYDALLEEVHRCRQKLGHMAAVLANPVTVRYRNDAPPGYGTSFDMSQYDAPDLERLGDALYEWQQTRQKLIDLLADPDLDEQTALYLDSKLHVRVVGASGEQPLSFPE